MATSADLLSSYTFFPYILCVWGFFCLFVSVYYVCTVPKEVLRWFQIPWSWSQTILWVLELEPRSSGRTALNCGAISPVPPPFDCWNYRNAVHWARKNPLKITQHPPPGPLVLRLTLEPFAIFCMIKICSFFSVFGGIVDQTQVLMLGKVSIT